MKTAISIIATAALLAVAGAANAATVYATSATIVVDGPRGTSNNRDNIANALGDTLGDFFELGRGATVDFFFGRNFTGPGNVVEVTFGNGPRETAKVQVGRGGIFTDITDLANNTSQGPNGMSFEFAGNFDTLRLIDTTPANASMGYDVDRVGVAAVPLPAAGLLLLAGLGGLVAVRRRKD